MGAVARQRNVLHCGSQRRLRIQRSAQRLHHIGHWRSTCVMTHRDMRHIVPARRRLCAQRLVQRSQLPLIVHGQIRHGRKTVAALHLHCPWLQCQVLQLRNVCAQLLGRKLGRRMMRIA